jgi:glycerol-3-phosphate dehydrogenase
MALADNKYDVIIVGAGAFGSCAAWDAASRGLSVALVDRGDFCNATSANHLKIVHGGIRYLQHLDFSRVRESCRERSALLRIAPHLVHPLPVVMPTYGHGLEGKEVLGAGFLLYDFIVFDRNRGIRDRNRRIPWGRMITRDQCLELFPGLAKERLTGAGIFYEAQFYNPPRLALAFLKSAVKAGAHIGNYLEVSDFLKKGNHIYGVKVKDVLTGEEFEILGKIVLNASGPWANNVVGNGTGRRLKPKPNFSRDAGFVVRRRLTGNYGLACRINTNDPDAVFSRKGRHIFMVPWRGYTLIGVWHVVHNMGPDQLTVTENELEGFLEELNGAYPTLDLELKDISMVYAGLTLFGDNDVDAKNLRFGHRSLLIDHGKEHQIEGLVTLIGVRATTARGMAEKAITLVGKKLGKKLPNSETERTAIYGGEISSFEEFLHQAISNNTPKLSTDVIRSLVCNYGSEYEKVLRLVDENSALAETVPDTHVLKAEVIHAVRQEMAQKLGDVVFRRTELGTGEHPGEKALQICANLMANELSWSESRVTIELDEVRANFPRFRC